MTWLSAAGDVEAGLIAQTNDFPSSRARGLDERMDCHVNGRAMEYPTSVRPDARRPGERNRDHRSPDFDGRSKRAGLEGQELVASVPHAFREDEERRALSQRVDHRKRAGAARAGLGAIDDEVAGFAYGQAEE